MTKSLINTNKYKELVSDLLVLIKKAQERAMSAINEIRLKTYWEMGKKINEAQTQIAPSESDIFVSSLSAELKMDKSLLYRIMQFQKNWPDEVPSVDGTFLTWTHHVELLSVKEAELRKFYLKAATEENWNRNILRKAIQKDYYHQSQIDPERLTTLKRDKNPLYVYRAEVENVVDGDTLLVRIDLGFGVWISQRVRFRGINTAELTKNGVPIADASERALKAKAFVEDKLKGIPFVVLKSYKTDIYGRFVADVFYHPTLEKKEDIAVKGIFLNEEILQAGFADLAI